MIAPKCDEEEARLEALHRYHILDTPRERDFDDITRLIARICDAPIAVVSLIDRDRQWFKSEVGLGVRETPLDTSICAHALLQSELFVVPDTLLDPRFADNPLVTGPPHLRFYAGTLLKTQDGHALGTLCVLDYKPRNLTDEQRDALQILGRQVMTQIELRHRIAEQAQVIVERQQAQERLEAAYARERNIARTLQEALLPDLSRRTFADVEVIPIYQAAWQEAQVGGDFYDAFSLPDGSVALVVGDVAGKGLAAATRTAEAKYALRVFLREDPQPARALTRLNNFLSEAPGEEDDNLRFIGLTLAVIAPSSGVVRLAMAGAEPPTLLRRDGGVVTCLSHGLPLGIFSGADYQNVSLTLAPGDTLLLVTDGLTEARNADSFLELEGVQMLALKAQNAPTLQAMGNAILEGAQQFASGSLHDDACLLLARRKLN